MNIQIEKSIFLVLVFLQAFLYVSFNILSIITQGFNMLIVGIAGGTAIFLLIPSLLLFLWGKKIYLSDKSRSIYWGIKLSLIPLYVFGGILLLAFVSMLIAPAGVGNS